MNTLLEVAGSVDTRVALGVFLVAIDAWAVGMLARSDGSRRDKWLWAGVIVFCPIVGCVLWYVLGPKPAVAAHERGKPGGGPVAGR